MVPDQVVDSDSVRGEPCVFCAIVQDKAPASRVYADSQVVAFMDMRPVNPGHVLVVPVAHASHLADLDEETGAHMFRLGQRLAAALRASGLPCEGINLWLADGAAAFQSVFHIHLHVLPRFRGDGFGFRFPPGHDQPPTRAELDEMAAGIRRALEA